MNFKSHRKILPTLYNWLNSCWWPQLPKFQFSQGHSSERIFPRSLIGKDIPKLTRRKGHSQGHSLERVFPSSLIGKDIPKVTHWKGYSQGHSLERVFPNSLIGKNIPKVTRGKIFPTKVVGKGFPMALRRNCILSIILPPGGQGVGVRFFFFFP